MHGSTLPHRPVTALPHSPAREARPSLSFLWLEITGRCQLTCGHCYADSGPSGTHGSMADADWGRVIDQAAGLGVGTVQFIGGEPTLHPSFSALVDHALMAGLDVEVFSNLVHVTPQLWETFGRPRVRLACSYYSDNPDQHAVITGRAGSHARTRANIVEAVRRSIPLRVGLVDLDDEQRTAEAVAELTALGVVDVGTDRVRAFGRGADGGPQSMSGLCGQCAGSVLAVGPDGAVWPCIMSRRWPVGSVLTHSLAEILASELLADTRAAISTVVGVTRAACDPKGTCAPGTCAPHGCGPSGSCMPDFCKPSTKLFAASTERL